MKHRLIIYIITFVVAFSGSATYIARCLCSDEHLHIAGTINEIDCNHLKPSPRGENVHHYLKQHLPFTAPSCYACVDVPLASHCYLLQQNHASSNGLLKKLMSLSTTLSCSSSSLPLLTMTTGNTASQPATSYCAFNVNLGSVLRR